MTFRAQSDTDFVKVRKRKIYLTVFEWLIYAILLTLMIIQVLMIVYKQGWWELFPFYSEFTTLAFALTILFAARHIHVNSKQVESLGIRTSSTIIKLYVTIWIGLAICNLIYYTLHIWYSVILLN